MKIIYTAILVGCCALAFVTPAQNGRAAETLNPASRELVLVSLSMVNAEAAREWKREGFGGVAVVLADDTSSRALATAEATAASQGLELYLWIEVARNPALADAHPRWMSSLGSHNDWQKRFPKTKPPGKGEVAKAWPWVPVWYREAFDAHLRRIDDLLKHAPDGYRGILLNEVQGGPSSCGCGNLQCRWATDYQVPATGTRIPGNEAPAKFTTEVRKRAPNKDVIPIWTTECEDEDLPADQRHGKPSTGLCGTVGCAVGLCPKDFTKQWSALPDTHTGPVGLLGLHREFERGSGLYGSDAGWLTNAVAYLDSVPPANRGKALSRDRLWLVIQGKDAAEESAARQIAKQLGAATTIVARTRIDQSFEPRIISAK
jgi:hypothetical protein